MGNAQKILNLNCFEAQLIEVNMKKFNLKMVLPIFIFASPAVFAARYAPPQDRYISLACSTNVSSVQEYKEVYLENNRRDDQPAVMRIWDNQTGTLSRVTDVQPAKVDKASVGRHFVGTSSGEYIFLSYFPDARFGYGQKGNGTLSKTTNNNTGYSISMDCVPQVKN
jgi:hypothetical protein